MDKNLSHNNYTSSDSCSLDANWWIFGLRGTLSIIFGVLALFMPFTAVLAMTIIFGVYAIIDGIFSIISGINRARKGKQWGWLIFSGVVSIGAGIAALVAPHVATLALTAFFWATLSAWAIATGISEVIAAIRLRREIKGEWLLALSGILSTILGVWIFVLFWTDPEASVVSFGLLTGFYSIIYGVLLLLLTSKLLQREKKNSSLAVERA